MLRRRLEVLALFPVVVFYWIYSRLWRVTHVRYPSQQGEKRPRIWAHYHGDELLLVGRYAFRGLSVMASRSRDGELMGRALQWLGYRVVRGSSSRGGAGGLKGLIDCVLKEGRDADLAVDGPRGPVYRVKPGVLLLAQATGAMLVPGAAAASRRFVFKKAWNRCYFPLPFSRCVIVYGEPFRVPKDLTDAEFEALRLDLEARLLELKREAEGRFARTVEVPGPTLLSMKPTGV